MNSRRQGTLEAISEVHLYPSLKYCCLCVMLSHLSHVQLFATPWTIARQAPLSMGFPRQEYWSGLPCPPPWDLLNPGIELESLKSPTLAGGFFTTSTTWEALISKILLFYRVVIIAGIHVWPLILLLGHLE